jgi:hypothetical protein
MNAQDERDYLLSLSHMTDIQLLKESDELQTYLDKGELADAYKDTIEVKLQIIFAAILRREAFDEMSMEELNKCISDNQREHEDLDGNSSEEEAYWNAYIWEADARAEFMRRMERLVHDAFTEESSEDSEGEGSE